MAGVWPEERVGLPLMAQRWRAVTFLHWPLEPAVVQALLPDGLVVDTFDGAAWVSLTPFAIERARPLLVPPVPRVSTFPETNLRTYVVGPDGRDGLWFFTLEADSAATVTGAMPLGLPYRWAAMELQRDAQRISYRSRRRRTPKIGHRIVVEPSRHPVAEDDARCAWLTGRWRAWTRVGPRFAAFPAEHERWNLVHATVVTLEENLSVAAGLPRLGDEPLVHFSAGVSARLGWPRLVPVGAVASRRT